MPVIKHINWPCLAWQTEWASASCMSIGIGLEGSGHERARVYLREHGLRRGSQHARHLLLDAAGPERHVGRAAPCT